MEILSMETSHAGQVAQLHMENLPTPFRGRAGHELLKLYYETVAKHKGGCGYVALSQDDIVGYICGIWDTQELRNSLFLSHWPLLVLWGTVQVMVEPKLIFDFLNRFRSSGLVNRHVGAKKSGYELRPIVVALNKRHGGLGEQLVKKLVDDARLRGYDLVYLYVEQDNVSAQRLYKKGGFVETGKQILNDRQYLRYELGLLRN